MKDKEILFKYIRDLLIKNYSRPTGMDIVKVINETKEYLAKDSDLFSQIIGSEHTLSTLSEGEGEEIKKKLVEAFSISAEEGVFILGKKQNEIRDKEWWSSEKEKEVKNYYWKRYKEKLKSGDLIASDVVETIDKDTDNIMNNLGSPKSKGFDVRGMVVGYVQSGKTGNYAALMCKAADAGYKVIVVIAGATDNLRNQTQERLNKDFVGKDGQNQVGVGIGRASDGLTPVSLTGADSDFKKEYVDQNIQLESIKTPVLLVIKKNSSILSNVIEWLKSQNSHSLNKELILVIDDESDYASVNTKEEKDPSKINERIRDLLIIFKRTSYVAYTATPFATILIDHEASHEDVGEDLFPKDFIVVLNPPDNYLGPKEIFMPPNTKIGHGKGGSVDSKFICTIGDHVKCIPMKHKKSRQISSLPNSLKDAIRTFFINVAIRNLRGQDKEHNSMMVNVTRFTDVHKRIASKIEQYLEEVKNQINTYKEPEASGDRNRTIEDFEKTFTLRYKGIQPNWPEVLAKLVELAQTVEVHEEHMLRSKRLEYLKEKPINVIVVGGLSLSRGFTLEGLSVSYFIRKTSFYDTLMQMGRWCGYRVGYEDLVKIYSSKVIITNFIYVVKAMEALYDDFRKMSAQGKTPLELGLAVQRDPASFLHITAMNKQKNAVNLPSVICLDGDLVETSRLLKEETDRKWNVVAIKKIIEDLKDMKVTYNNGGTDRETGTYLWESVEKSVIRKFLKNFIVSASDSSGFKPRMPIGSVKEYASKVNTNWDVVLYSGSGDEWGEGKICINKGYRTFKLTKDEVAVEIEGKRRISGGPATEAVSLINHPEYNEIKGDRKKIRERLKRPLLMLHILQPLNPEECGEFSEIAAFGASFPSKNINSMPPEIERVANTVLQKLMMFDTDEEEGD